MSDYTPVNDFSAKDVLSASDPEKIILGSDVDAETAAIQVAVNSKLDSSDLATQPEAEDRTDNTKLLTPLRGSQLVVDYLLDTYAPASGSFSVQFGPVSSGGSGTMYWRKFDGRVSIWCITDIVGVSSATTLTLDPSTIPLAARPTSGRWLPCMIVDNGLQYHASVAFGNDGSAVFARSQGATVSSTGFTSSGNKGVFNGWTVSYPA